MGFVFAIHFSLRCNIYLFKKKLLDLIELSARIDDSRVMTKHVGFFVMNSPLIEK